VNVRKGEGEKRRRGEEEKWRKGEREKGRKGDFLYIWNNRCKKKYYGTY